MRHISEFTEYKGGDIKSQVLYTSKVPLVITGQVEFNIFGKAKINGITVQDVTIRAEMTETKIEMYQNSAIVFYKAPCQVKDIPEHIPVPDIPEYEDQATASLAAMIDEILRKRGLGPDQAEGAEQEFDDNEEDEYDDDYDGPELSQLTLVAKPENVSHLEEVEIEEENVSEDADQVSEEPDPVADPEVQQNSTS